MFLGIDFGTSFSKASTIYLNQPLLLMNPGEYGIPSEFYYDRETGVLVGQAALDAGQGYAASNLVSEVKMAIRYGNSFMLDGTEFTAKQIVSEIYRAIVKKAVQIAKKHAVDTKIEGVVISVPAKFGLQERYLIMSAAKECLEDEALPIKAVIKEPVAAALSYFNVNPENNKHILVYDLGGGTCDIALVKSDASVAEHYTVVDTDMLYLGGRDWDSMLIAYLTDMLESKTGILIRGNVSYENKIRRAAIAAKHELSDSLNEKTIARVELNGKICSVVITRDKFDAITAHLLKKTIECIRDVYNRNAANCKIEDIICVGGSSNMLQVEEGLKRAFPRCNVRLSSPEHAVVNGAAIYANMPQKEMLVDMASFSYGVESNTHYGFPDNKKIVSNIIQKGTHLPVIGQKNYSPAHENQEVVAFNIYESDLTDDEYDFDFPNKRLIGTVGLRLPPGSPKDLNLSCQLALNAEGLIEIEASEPSGKNVYSQFKVNEL